MPKSLIIVESPTKAKTISKFLNGKYAVEASFGHVRDLPKSKLSIDVEHSYTPKYVIPDKAKEVIKKLKLLAADAPEIILATDEDREGESISWHLQEALGLNDPKIAAKHDIKRITFHEITDSAIKHALEHPRKIDLALVNAQQARRVIDRLVGYELSPFLWRKIRYGLSAGRVQSVAVRLVVDREREILAFQAQEYWSVIAELETDKNEKFTARLQAWDGKVLGKFGIGDSDTAQSYLQKLEGAKYIVESVTAKEVGRNPAAPFTTSTLQQEAARKLGFSAKQTMTLAQGLYEHGFITYMRTDSVNLAQSALTTAAETIRQMYGSQYALAEPRKYANKSKGAQEAHEAIRPTNLAMSPDDFKSTDNGQHRLYDLIWKRTIASQMTPAVMEQTSVDIAAGPATFRATGSVIKFDGFLRVYREDLDDDTDEDGDGILPALLEKQILKLLALTPRQHFTEPPPRFTDASLVKALEAHGVGRPSTYAPTMTTIQDRGYVEKIEKRYHPTEIGMIVTDLLVAHFPEIVDINFTSELENKFDEIADGQAQWVPTVDEFYKPFKAHLVEKEATVEKAIIVSNIPCPHCGKPMLEKFGRFGKFLACPDPESKVTMPMPEEQAEIDRLMTLTKEERCPICSSEMKVHRGRFGFFLGCINYPKCKGIAKIWNKIGYDCPNCLASTERKDKPGVLAEKKGRGRAKPFYGCTRYPDCNFVINIKPENQAQLDEMYQAWLKREAEPKKKAGRKIVKKSVKAKASSKTTEAVTA